jgi:hypothetical protein
VAADIGECWIALAWIPIREHRPSSHLWVWAGRRQIPLVRFARETAIGLRLMREKLPLLLRAAT